MGANGAVDASAHAAYGELGVDAFASAAASVFHAQAGFRAEATASFSDAFTFGWNDPKNFGKPVVVQSNILLDGGFSHSNVYEASSTFPPHDDFVALSLSVSCSSPAAPAAVWRTRDFLGNRFTMKVAISSRVS